MMPSVNKQLITCSACLIERAKSSYLISEIFTMSELIKKLTNFSQGFFNVITLPDVIKSNVVALRSIVNAWNEFLNNVPLSDNLIGSL